MKKVLKLVIIGVLSTILVACTNNNSDIEEFREATNDIPDTSVEQGSSPIDLDIASYLFERLDTILDADDGYLWGVNLHGPVVIADVQTRYAVANMPDEDGEIFTRQGDLYVGRLPEGTLIGNTASYFGGQVWGMVTWGFIEDEMDNLLYVTDVLIHELFHAQQHLIFEGYHLGYSTTHMNNLDARINVRLEINALLHALHTTGAERTVAVHNALSIRAERHRLYPEATWHENNFEMVEGTASYTEAVLGRDNLDDRLVLIEMYMDKDGDDIPITFGYHTGALYALLLDEFSIDWREGLSWETDLAALLKDGIGLTETIPFDEINVEHYGYSEIRPLEETWIAENERLIQEARDALSGPLLLIDAEGEFNYFDAEAADIRVIHLDGLELYASDEFDYGQEEIHLLEFARQPLDQTVFYGNFTYTAHFGKLEFTGGFLHLLSVMWRHGIPAIEMEIDGNRIITPGWVLTLNEGYKLREVDGGHFGIARQD